MPYAWKSEIPNYAIYWLNWYVINNSRNIARSQGQRGETKYIFLLKIAPRQSFMWAMDIYFYPLVGRGITFFKYRSCIHMVSFLHLNWNFNFQVTVDHLFFIGAQLVALSPTGNNKRISFVFLMSVYNKMIIFLLGDFLIDKMDRSPVLSVYVHLDERNIFMLGAFRYRSPVSE